MKYINCLGALYAMPLNFINVVELWHALLKFKVKKKT